LDKNQIFNTVAPDFTVMWEVVVVQNVPPVSIKINLTNRLVKIVPRENGLALAQILYMIV
jgi:hypothetical protein